MVSLREMRQSRPQLTSLPSATRAMSGAKEYALSVFIKEIRDEVLCLAEPALIVAASAAYGSISTGTILTFGRGGGLLHRVNGDEMGFDAIK